MRIIFDMMEDVSQEDITEKIVRIKHEKILVKIIEECFAYISIMILSIADNAVIDELNKLQAFLLKLSEERLNHDNSQLREYKNFLKEKINFYDNICLQKNNNNYDVEKIIDSSFISESTCSFNRYSFTKEFFEFFNTFAKYLRSLSIYTGYDYEKNCYHNRGFKRDRRRNGKNLCREF